jgi:hypothetical protein
VLGNLKGFKIPRNCPAISHLLFANDLLIFGRASSSKASCIYGFLDKYPSSILDETPALMPSITSVPSSLSISIPLGRFILVSLYCLATPKMKAFNPIVEKVQGKIVGWRVKSLSLAGRVMLIKSVVASFPSYAMSTLLLPNGICK